VDTAVRAAIRGAELTRRLLAFSRQQMLAPELVDMNALVTGMEDLLRRSLGDAVEVVTDFAPGLWPIEADPGQLENALLNLAINGRDAMPDGGRLTLRTRNRPVGPGELERHPDVAPGEFVTLAVTDNGTGIAAEHVSQVFEPFFTTKEAGKGSGLGLSMVYGFVEQSGGFVDIDSQPGLGTTVTLHFPRCTREGAVRDRAPPPQAGELPRGSETVLVVEDEEDVRETVVSLLGELGYRVLPVATPGEALETLAREPDVAVLFTDVMMPGGIRGTQLAQRARELRPKLRVLYTTGFTSTGILQREMLSERAEMIGKPYTNEELAHVLRGLLDENG
jgi:CheY-like chemotaxis protein